VTGFAPLRSLPEASHGGPGLIAAGLRLCFEDHVERRLAPRNQIPSMSNVSIVRPCSSYQQVVLGNVPDGATARARGQRARWLKPNFET
jgi:D-serine dehydratase